MAYALPTVAVTLSPASPVEGVPFTLIATVTSTGDEGIKLRRGYAARMSGPAASFGQYDIISSVTLQPIPKFAGVNKPTGADYVANAGGSATTVLRIPAIVYGAGTSVVKVHVALTRDSDDSEVEIFAADTSITVAARS